MNKKVYDCSIERKEFVKGSESIKYYDIVINIDGVDVRATFKEKDKKLAEYLLDKED